jgi:hypothetical protein
MFRVSMAKMAKTTLVFFKIKTPIFLAENWQQLEKNVIKTLDFYF